MREPLFVFVRIPESLEPLEKAEKYEDPHEESLASKRVRCIDRIDVNLYALAVCKIASGAHSFCCGLSPVGV